MTESIDQAQLTPAASPRFGGPKSIAPVWHTVSLLLVIIGFSILPQFVHVPLQPGPAAGVNRMATYFLTMLYELGMLAWIWVFCRFLYGVPMREIIGGRWEKPVDVLIDVAYAMLLWAAVVVLLLFAHFVLHFSGVKAAQAMYPTTLAEAIVFVILAVLAGFCEEVIFRGYFMRQFTAWTHNVIAGVVLQAILFGLGHGYQGWKGMVVISVYGSFFGILAVLRKSLRPGMINHCAQDGFSGVLVYIAQKYHLPMPMLRF
jgi:uncharacterized protein